MCAPDRLVDDAPFRESLRSRAYDEVFRNRRLVDHIGDRLAFYQELLPSRSRGGRVSDELLAVAERQGRYLRLVSGPSEQPLIQARSAPASSQGLRPSNDWSATPRASCKPRRRSGSSTTI